MPDRQQMAEIVIAQAAKVQDVCWLAKQILSPQRYAEYIYTLDVSPFRDRQTTASLEHGLRCGLTNDDAKAMRLALMNLPWPSSVAECETEMELRKQERRLIFDQQDQALRESRQVMLANIAEAKADEHAEKVRLLVQFSEEVEADA